MLVSLKVCLHNRKPIQNSFHKLFNYTPTHTYAVKHKSKFNFTSLATLLTWNIINQILKMFTVLNKIYIQSFHFTQASLFIYAYIFCQYRQFNY